ncbi:MAG: type II toxin-antitoxin system VapC family toxin [Deltaproteobacteria bacterium]|jgi:PIN domain nuclease of toxin-antitoxin system|nr:type II toxin-antitoxin system VapC family toxin [Deltaproteobacteria bacterium]MBW2670941.1 type II toxin-antitoxin system VapC family toxin [Deltaproteobacteria bacterium]
MIVVDTHIILWNALKPEMLSRKAKKAISAANNSDGIIFCDISLWEIAMLMHKGRLSIDVEYLEFIKLVSESNNYVYRGITPEIARLSAKLFSDNNKDPADRIIAATSIIENAKLVTADKKLRQSRKVTTIW